MNFELRVPKKEHNPSFSKVTFQTRVNGDDVFYTFTDNLIPKRSGLFL